MRIELPQLPVRLDESVVALRIEAHELVGAHQTAEAVPVRGSRWHFIRLVDQRARQLAVLFQHCSQPTEHLVVGEPAMAGENDAPYGVERRLIDEWLERVLVAYPHVG